MPQRIPAIIAEIDDGVPTVAGDPIIVLRLGTEAEIGVPLNAHDAAWEHARLHLRREWKRVQDRSDDRAAGG